MMNLRARWLFLVLLLSCQPNDHTTHASYPVIEEFLSAQQLYEHYNIQNVSVDRFTLSNAKLQFNFYNFGR